MVVVVVVVVAPGCLEKAAAPTSHDVFLAAHWASKYCFWQHWVQRRGVGKPGLRMALLKEFLFDSDGQLESSPA